jgi:hypothetical protein
LSRRDKTVADPVDLSMIVSSALPATFTFLYQRLEALLSRNRAGSDVHQSDMPSNIPDVLEGELQLPLTFDEREVEARSRELNAYALALALYDRDPSRISRDDPELVEILSTLRGALEEIYGQRLTFRGEQRERSGPFSDQRFGNVAGQVIGMEAENSIRGDVTSKITAESVDREGRIIGMRARDIGNTD